MSVYIGQLTRRPLKGVHRGSEGEGWGERVHVIENRQGVGQGSSEMGGGRGAKL